MQARVLRHRASPPTTKRFPDPNDDCVVYKGRRRRLSRPHSKASSRSRPRLHERCKDLQLCDAHGQSEGCFKVRGLSSRGHISWDWNDGLATTIWPATWRQRKPTPVTFSSTSEKKKARSSVEASQGRPPFIHGCTQSGRFLLMPYPRPGFPCGCAQRLASELSGQGQLCLVRPGTAPPLRSEETIANHFTCELCLFRRHSTPISGSDEQATPPMYFQAVMAILQGVCVVGQV